MEGPGEMSPVHVYRCASCGHRFESEGFSNRCPQCRGKVLMHESGPPRRSRSCQCGGSCGGCRGCGGH